MQNNVPPPLFAPSSQQQEQGGDDFDLNEIFAEYFINEFEDPMNAYTSSMANTGAAANYNPMGTADAKAPKGLAAAQAPAVASGGVQVGLPTGGIRTSFHAAPASAPRVADNGAPPAKRPKQEAAGAPHPAAAGVQPPQMAAAAAVQQAVLNQQAAAASVSVARPAGAVQLPVGVGIRLGGLGGVAPQLAQSTPRATLGAAVTAANAQQQQSQQQFSVWGPAAGGGGVVTEHAALERRQRNREHAKRSRVRKKFMLESLQQEVRELQKKNHELRLMVQEHIPEHAMQIIAECCKPSPVFDDLDLGDPAQKAQQESLVKTDMNLMTSLTIGQQCFVLSDPKLPDNPIIFASPGFYKLTGYTSKEVLGRNCRFLQGPGTDTRAVEVIRKAVATGSDANVCLLNYKADGTPFWNQFFVGALRDSDNCIVNYVGVQCEVEPEAGQAALEERVNQVLPLQTKDEEDGAAGGTGAQ